MVFDSLKLKRGKQPKSPQNYTNHQTLRDAVPQAAVPIYDNTVQSPVNHPLQQHQHTCQMQLNCVANHQPHYLTAQQTYQPHIVAPAPQPIQCTGAYSVGNETYMNQDIRISCQALNQQYHIASPTSMTHTLSPQVPTYQNNPIQPNPLPESGPIMRTQVVDNQFYSNQPPYSATQLNINQHQNHVQPEYNNLRNIQCLQQPQQQQQHLPPHPQQQQPTHQQPYRQQVNDNFSCSNAFHTPNTKMVNSTASTQTPQQQHQQQQPQQQVASQTSYQPYQYSKQPQTRPQSQPQPRMQTYQSTYSNESVRNNTVHQDYQNHADIAQNDEDLSLETQIMLYNETKEDLAKQAVMLEKQFSQANSEMQAIRAMTPSYKVKEVRL